MIVGRRFFEEIPIDNGRVLVEVFDRFPGKITPVYTLPETVIRGHKVIHRVRQMIDGGIGKNLGWLKCLHSADGTFVFASLEVHISKEKAEESFNENPSTSIVKAVWYEPVNYYSEGKFLEKFFPSNNPEGSGAESFDFIAAFFPFQIGLREIE